MVYKLLIAEQAEKQIEKAIAYVTEVLKIRKPLLIFWTIFSKSTIPWKRMLPASPFVRIVTFVQKDTANSLFINMTTLLFIALMKILFI